LPFGPDQGAEDERCQETDKRVHEIADTECVQKCHLKRSFNAAREKPRGLNLARAISKDKRAITPDAVPPATTSAVLLAIPTPRPDACGSRFGRLILRRK
jgi:hypothetical protein